MIQDKSKTQSNQEPTLETGEATAMAGNEGPKFSQDELKKAVSKAVHEALTAAGRDVAVLDRQKKTVEEAQNRLTQAETEWRQRKEDLEEQAAADNPEALDGLKLKRKAEAKLEEARRKLDEVRSKEESLASVLQEAQQLKAEKMIASVAARYDLSLADLAEYADLSPERLEKLASSLAKAQAPSGPSRTDSHLGTGQSTEKNETMQAYIQGKITAVEAAKRGVVFS